MLSQAGTEGTPHLLEFIANEDTGVDGEDAWTALSDGDEVEKLLFVNPTMLIDDFRFYHRYHGISTTQGECTNLEEGGK